MFISKLLQLEISKFLVSDMNKDLQYKYCLINSYL